MKQFTILYGNTKTETIERHTLKEAEISAHKKAREEKTIVIRVTENIVLEN